MHEREKKFKALSRVFDDNITFWKSKSLSKLLHKIFSIKKVKKV